MSMLPRAKTFQAHNRKLKQHVARTDAENCYQAMHGGLTGIGCNDSKLIAALCGRTKTQLRHTAKQFREKYDKDLRKDVKGEAGGSYGKMMWYALAPPEVYVADAIDAACVGMGCNEMALLELLVCQSTAGMAAGRACWEGRHDGSLIDYLDKELGFDYRHLQALLFELLKGVRDEGSAVDEGKLEGQIATLNKECKKGAFSDFKENIVISVIAPGNPTHNAALAKAYELKHSKSLSAALKKKCGKKFHACLEALLMPKADFVAKRLKDAMAGWGADKGAMARLLGGLDGDGMAAVCASYERKYGLPLASSLRDELGGSMERAACSWVAALQDPSRGLEAKTEADLDALAAQEEGEDLVEDVLDALGIEQESVLSFAAQLDAERIAEACRGLGTNDTKLIMTVCSRNKAHLDKVARAYRGGVGKGKSLMDLVVSEVSGWYKYLLQFILLTESASDVRLLDLAMDGLGTDEAALIEFFCARPAARIQAARAAWEGKHDGSLVDRLNGELSGDVRRFILMKLQQGAEPCGAADGAVATGQAEQLYAAGEGVRGTDEAAFIEILLGNSREQNWALAKAYEAAHQRSLQKAIRSEFGGMGERDIRNALLSMLQDPIDWYAARLKDAFKGFGTADRVVCRILGCNDKATVKLIAASYERKYGKPLAASIKSECSGNYKRCAISWIVLPDELVDLPDAPLTAPEDMPSEEERPMEAAAPPPPPPKADGDDVDSEDEYEQPMADVPPPYLAAPVPMYAPQRMVVRCPPGVGPGMQILIAAPSGEQFTVVVPQGVPPYGQFAVVVPHYPRGGAAGGGVEVLRSSFDGKYKKASDVFVCVASLRLCGALVSAEAKGKWSDQGWGNQKGSLKIRLVRGGAVVAEKSLEGLAPHKKAKFAMRIEGAELPGAQAGDMIEVAARVGGGGGHELHLKKTSVEVQCRK